MLITTETRWFQKGELPKSLVIWFHQDQLGLPPGEPETRTDRYLLIPNCEFTNLKLRQGSLEIKLRQRQHDQLCGDRALQGQVEQWAKWSCQGEVDADAQPQDVAPEQVWMAVQKTRSQRFYHLDPDDQAVAAFSSDEFVESGCQVELTQLKVHPVSQAENLSASELNSESTLLEPTSEQLEQAWWSFALEAWGPVAQQLPLLQAVTQWLDEQMQPHPPIRLSLAQSYAYPKWLHKQIASSLT